MARPLDKSPLQGLPGGQTNYYELIKQLWMGWTAVMCILSFLSGVGVSYYVFQGTCDDVNDAATWNLIAAWRSLRAASMNPILAMFSPQTTQAAGVAAAAPRRVRGAAASGSSSESCCSGSGSGSGSDASPRCKKAVW